MIKHVIFSENEVLATLDGRKTMFRRQLKPDPQGRVYKVHNHEEWSDTDWGHEYKCPFGQAGDQEWQTGEPPIEGRIYFEGYGGGYICTCESEYFYRSGTGEVHYMEGVRWKRMGTILAIKETFVNYHTINHVRRSSGASFSEVSDGLYAYKADGFNGVEDFKTHIRLMSGSDYEGIEVKDNRWQSPAVMPLKAARIWVEVTGVKVKRLWDIGGNDIIAEGIGEKYISDESSIGYWEGRQRYIYAQINKHLWQRNPWMWGVEFRVLSTTGKPSYL